MRIDMSRPETQFKAVVAEFIQHYNESVPKTSVRLVLMSKIAILLNEGIDIDLKRKLNDLRSILLLDNTDRISYRTQRFDFLAGILLHNFDLDEMFYTFVREIYLLLLPEKNIDTQFELYLRA